MNETAREFATVFLPAATFREGRHVHELRAPGPARAAGRAAARRRRGPTGRSSATSPGPWAAASGFGFGSAGEIWDEVRAAWPAGRGHDRRAARRVGRAVAVPGRTGAGHASTSTQSRSAPVPARRCACIDYVPTPETVTPEFPLLLTTGRSLYQFNAGTMTGRGRTRTCGPPTCWRSTPVDAARPGSRPATPSGAEPLRRGAAPGPGYRQGAAPAKLFATFQDPAAMVNLLTSSHGDRITKAPEYKVTAVRVERG